MSKFRNRGSKDKQPIQQFTRSIQMWRQTLQEFGEVQDKVQVKTETNKTSQNTDVTSPSMGLSHSSYMVVTS